MANIFDEILSELKGIKEALATAGWGDGAKATETTKNTDKPKTTTKPKGPTLETVQEKIVALCAADDANKELVKAAIVKLGGKRAGDFEGDTAKLTKLLAALDGIENDAGGDDAKEEDDDLL